MKKQIKWTDQSNINALGRLSAKRAIANSVVELATKELSNADFTHVQRALVLGSIHLAATRAMDMLTSNNPA